MMLMWQVCYVGLSASWQNVIQKSVFFLQNDAVSHTPYAAVADM